jgi:hypothetical protein
MNASETEQAGMQTVVGGDCMEPVPSSTRERLDSWKEITRYLRRSIRCVQRWEKNEAANPASPARPWCYGVRVQGEAGRVVERGPGRHLAS